MKNLPTHIAFIVDGNRRWAKKRGLSTFEGHRRGFELMKKVINWCLEKDIRILTFYIFSTENWKRSHEEVDYLINRLFARELFKKHVEVLKKQNIKIIFSGRKYPLTKSFQKAMKDIMRSSKNNSAGIVNFALNYGGRPEIVDAIKKIIKKKIPSQKIDEDLVKKNLYAPELSYPDLMIRTSGEKRLSNFLLWQLAYTELCFLKKNWPDFMERDLEKALRDYSRRKRRFGGN